MESEINYFGIKRKLEESVPGNTSCSPSSEKKSRKYEGEK